MGNDFLQYALKVTLFHAACYFLYWTVLRRSNYFSLNRAFLVFTLILGFVAPVVMLPVATLPVEHVIGAVDFGHRGFSESELRSVADYSTQDVTGGFSVVNGLLIIYLVGVLILLLRSVFGILLIYRLKSRGIEAPGSSPKIVTIKEGTSFSFIDTILLREKDGPLVLLHEKCHVGGKHWVDLIFMEIICIFCWVDPIVWIYRRSLKQQHEYLADDYVLRHGVSQEEYLLCMLNSLSWDGPGGPIHKFNSQSLKQRILMMTKEKYLPYPKLVYVSAAALVALLFLSFSGSKSYEGPSKAERIFVIDAAHGGNDAGAISGTGLAEKDIALNLSKLVREIGKEKGLNILLTRTADETLSLEERISFSTNANADVFLSLHLGFDESGNNKGVAMYVSERNRKYNESKRIAAALRAELGGIKELGDPQIGNFDYLVIKQNPAASAILEVGCLSDARDAKFIADPANQRKIAGRIVSALAKY